MLIVRLTPQQLKNLETLLTRVDLKGREVPAYNEILKQLLLAEPEGNIKVEEVE